MLKVKFKEQYHKSGEEYKKEFNVYGTSDGGTYITVFLIYLECKFQWLAVEMFDPVEGK